MWCCLTNQTSVSPALMYLVLQTQNYKPLRGSSTQSWLVPPSFYAFQLLVLYLFTLLHHRHKIKPDPDVIVPVARFSPFPSLILKNVTISVLVCMCYCSCLTHGQLQIPLGYGFLIVCLFTCVHRYLIFGKYSFKIY